MLRFLGFQVVFSIGGWKIEIWKFSFSHQHLLTWIPYLEYQHDPELYQRITAYKQGAKRIFEHYSISIWIRICMSINNLYTYCRFCCFPSSSISGIVPNLYIYFPIYFGKESDGSSFLFFIDKHTLWKKFFPAMCMKSNLICLSHDLKKWK